MPPTRTFPEERVVVECDGWLYHRDRETFESDRDRDTERLAAGILTVRVTKRRLTRTPEREAERLHTILARRRGEAAAA
jgi:very-short-patch-repair endonuclease